jgi:Raf kinase inhibitor-like YbhB/YbcL family protein
VHIRSDSFRPYDFLDAALAFGKHDPASNIALAGNRNPHLGWSGVPDNTRSFVVLCFDVDGPTDGTDVNQTDRSVPLDLPRADFFHWVAADLPANLREIAEGAHSEGITPRGKAAGATPSGGLQGINDYTSWFASDADMAGDYGGYDGPCPPFNDERVHGYHFAVYALDVESLGLSGAFTGPDVRAAMAAHILASAEIVGLYAINPAATPR